MKDGSVLGHTPYGPGDMVPLRPVVLEYLESSVARLDNPSPYTHERNLELIHLFIYSAVYENKLTPAEAAEWHDRIDRRYEEVTGQPAPPRPDNPLADLA